MQKDKGGGVAHGEAHHLINTNARSKLFRLASYTHPHLPVERIGQMSQSDEVKSDRITCGGTLHSHTHTHLQRTAFDGSL